MINQVPPNSLDSERAVLGAIMLNNKILTDMVSLLKVDDFYRTGHSLIFKAMIAIEDKGSAIDVVTVVEELKALNQLEKTGAVIVTSVPTTVLFPVSYVLV